MDIYGYRRRSVEQTNSVTDYLQNELLSHYRDKLTRLWDNVRVMRSKIVYLYLERYLLIVLFFCDRFQKNMVTYLHFFTSKAFLCILETINMKKWTLLSIFLFNCMKKVNKWLLIIKSMLFLYSKINFILKLRYLYITQVFMTFYLNVVNIKL